MDVETGVAPNIVTSSTSDKPKVLTDEVANRTTAVLSDTLRYGENLTQDEAQLCQQVIESGGVCMHQSMPASYRKSRKQGFQTEFDDSRMDTNADYELEELIYDAIKLKVPGAVTRSSHDLKAHMKAGGIFEVVGIRPRKKAMYEEVKTSRSAGGLAGMFGKKITETERRFARYRPEMHDEVVRGGKKEKAYSLVYAVTTEDFPDFVGRPGNMLGIEIVLPETLARACLEAIERNPGLIRRIVDSFVTAKMGVPEKAWKQGAKENGYGRPLSPPYEIMAKKGKTKMYITPENASLGFEKRFVKEL